MSDQKTRQLPLFLTQARARLGINQCVLSERTGILQTTLCSLETGRRSNPGPSIRDALVRGLELSQDDQSGLDLAIEHDRILIEVERGPLRVGAELVSAVLLANRLTDQEIQGVLRTVQDAVRTTQQYRALLNEPPAGNTHVDPLEA